MKNLLVVIILELDTVSKVQALKKSAFDSEL